MSKEKDLRITKELLDAEGWAPGSEASSIFYEKKLPNLNPLNSNDEDTGISLILHGMYNSTNFAVLFPDGSKLNFVANTMKDLREFESKIIFYDAAF